MLLLGPKRVYATTIEEDFDSYEENYSIDGEADWTYDYGDHLQTKSAQYNSAPYSLRGADTNGSWSTTWDTGIEPIEISFYYYDVSDNNDITTIYFKDDGSLVGYVQFEENDTISFKGNVSETNIGSINYGSWRQITCEFTDEQLRCKEDGEFGAWQNHNHDLPNQLNFDHNNENYDIYFDNFLIDDGAECQISMCNLCETYEDCSEAGCYWYLSPWPGLFDTGAYCVEPYVPDPEECGPFFKCQFCATQETCEGELNCEWWDKYGTGEACYMIEPAIPPEQGSWQVPDLEDCEELEGAEAWLCEIKNFIAGMFMPSQSKVDELQRTLGNFATKFPFNYLEAIRIFFDYVDDYAKEEQGVEIGILNATGTVDLSFWNATGAIGATEESISDMVIDFTSLLLVVGLMAYIMFIINSFIKL